MALIVFHEAICLTTKYITKNGKVIGVELLQNTVSLLMSLIKID